LKVLIHSNGPHVPSGYGKQARHAGKILRDLGHEVAFSCFSGLGGQPIRWEGYTLLPGGMLEFSPDMLVPHAATMGADLVIPLMDFYKLSPASAQWRQLTAEHATRMASFIISDCTAANGGPSILDQQVIPMFGAHPVAVSRFGCGRLEALGYGQGEFPYSYVPHCTDTAVYRPPADKAAARRELGTPGDFVIGIMSANSDGIRKNFQGQMAAFQRFSRKHKDAYLALFTVADSPRGLPLAQMASDLGIAERVVFMPTYEQVAGMTPEEMVAAWYGSLDVLSMCSYAEGFGVPLIEAQACGTPVVATDGSAMSELAREAGWLVKGERFWNVTHRAWWVQPSEDGIVRAWEKAYQAAGDASRREHARKFAAQYDVGAVRDAYWAPFMSLMEDLGGGRVIEQDGLKWHYADSFMFGDRLALGHEAELEAEVFKGLPEDGTFLDVGAHVGHYALRAAKRCARVLAVEANPRTYDRLEQNIELNHLHNVHHYNFAAWDKHEKLTLTSKHGHDYDGTDSLVPHLEDATEVKEIPVQAFRIDEVLAGEDRVDVVKIDVEGADLHVIRGMSGLLEKHRPRLFIEDHSVYGYYKRDDLDALLDSLGYSSQDIIPGFIEALPR
jgi:FkbM family methyltransferase